MGRSVATRYLEFLQKRAYEATGTEPLDEAEASSATIDRYIAQRVAAGEVAADEAAKLKETILDAMKAQLRPVPTRFERPGLYSVMVKMFEEIEDVATQAKIELPRRPTLGTLPTGQVNAMTVRVPDTSEYLVLLEHELFTFALLLSKAVARAFPLMDAEKGAFSTEPADVERRIGEDPSVVMRFADVITAYAITGRPANAEQYFVEPAYERVSSILRDSMEMFVLSHEYGHVAAGHLEQPDQVVAAMVPGTETASVAYAWEQEYEADYIGVALCLPAMAKRDEVDAALAYAGADLFFSAIDVVDRAVSLLDAGDETIETVGSHPPAADRRRFVREALVDLIGEEQGSSAARLAQAVEATVDRLWERTRPILLSLRESGMTPATKWTVATQRV